MNRRLIALMLGVTITATTMAGCGETKSSDEIRYEDRVRELLEYDANTNISSTVVKNMGFKLEYKIQEEKFYITFITQRWEAVGRISTIVDDAKITYEVDKDTYYNFKNSYNTEESENEVELVKNLTDKFDPIEVINPEGKIQEVN